MSIITKNIHDVAAHLQAGNVAAIPTETVYGLAAIADNDEAVRQIFALKNRPPDHPLIMHVSKNWDIERWAQKIPGYARVLMNAFWPGPLTLVFHCKEGAVNPLINGGQTSVALRCPNHTITQKLLDLVDKPLVAPSANPFGKISPTTAEHVRHSFQDKEILIFDGGRCRLGIESTIVAATHQEKFQILRHGSIDEAALEKTLPQCLQTSGEELRVPGRLKNHYQPEKPLYCFENLQKMLDFCQSCQQMPYVISFDKDNGFTQFPGYQLPQNPVDAAYEFYYQLRLADTSQAALIVMELPPDLPEWQALRERAIKARTG